VTAAEQPNSEKYDAPELGFRGVFFLRVWQEMSAPGAGDSMSP